MLRWKLHVIFTHLLFVQLPQDGNREADWFVKWVNTCNREGIPQSFHTRPHWWLWWRASFHKVSDCYFLFVLGGFFTHIQATAEKKKLNNIVENLKYCNHLRWTHLTLQITQPKWVIVVRQTESAINQRQLVGPAASITSLQKEEMKASYPLHVFSQQLSKIKNNFEYANPTSHSETQTKFQPNNLQ